MSEGSRRRVLPVSQGQSEANQGAGAGPRGGPVKCLLHECEDLSLIPRTRVKRLGMEAGLYSQCRAGNGWADSRSLVPSEPNLLGELQASERPCLNRAPEEQHLRLTSDLRMHVHPVFTHTYKKAMSAHHMIETINTCTSTLGLELTSGWARPAEMSMHIP